MATYFVLWYRLHQTDAYLIWYSNDQDGVIIDESSHIPTFHDQASLRRYASALGLAVSDEEPLLHDLDRVSQWLAHPGPQTIDCPLLFGAWNLFLDVASSVADQAFIQRQAALDHIYNKLFWGSNLPAMTPPGEHYTPAWKKREVALLWQTLDTGLKLFQAHLLFSPLS